MQVQLEQVAQGHLQLSWSISKNGDATVFLGNLAQCLTTLKVIFFFILNWNVPYFGLCPSPLVMSLRTSARSLVPSSLQPLIRQLQAAKSSRLHLLFPRLCKPSFLNILYIMLQPPSCLGVSAGLAPLFQYLSCTGKTRAGDIAPDAVSQVPERGKLSGPSICRQCSC